MKHLIVLCGFVLSGCLSPPDILVCRDLPERKIETRDEFGVINITIKENPVCIKEIKEPRCGYCVWTITKKPMYVGNNPEHQFAKKTWSEIRSTSVLLPLDSYVAIKRFINNSCKKHGDCRDDLGDWQNALDEIK